MYADGFNEAVRGYMEIKRVVVPLFKGFQVSRWNMGEFDFWVPGDSVGVYKFLRREDGVRIVCEKLLDDPNSELLLEFVEDVLREKRGGGHVENLLRGVPL